MQTSSFGVKWVKRVIWVLSTKLADNFHFLVMTKKKGAKTF